MLLSMKALLALLPPLKALLVVLVVPPSLNSAVFEPLKLAMVTLTEARLVVAAVLRDKVVGSLVVMTREVTTLPLVVWSTTPPTKPFSGWVVVVRLVPTPLGVVVKVAAFTE